MAVGVIVEYPWLHNKIQKWREGGGSNSRLITANVVILKCIHAIYGLLIRTFVYPIVKELSSSFVPRRKVVS